MSKTKNNFTKIDHEIKVLIYQLLELLGEKSTILSIIMSWKETMDDDFIVDTLKDYVEVKRTKLKLGK